MDEHKDAELAELAELLRERNALDARLGRLLDRPVNTGHIGEWIAARIFEIELEEAANAAGYDGHFTTGALVGRTVNVKAYGKFESLLDINPNAPLDYYLVFTGRKAAAMSSRGTLRPFCIDAVFLFDALRSTPSCASEASKSTKQPVCALRSGRPLKSTRVRAVNY
jgi:hypothetical protein